MNPPFLSIITRTQGRRPHTLVETLTSLTAQTNTDFEVLVLGHNLSVEARGVTQQILADTPAWFREKIRYIDVAGGNRTRPLNVGFSMACGAYISILDDDDIVLAHWVETFQALAKAEPGRVLRAISCLQTVQNITVQNRLGLIETSTPEPFFPEKFNFFSHIQSNRTPPLCLAFPSTAIAKYNLAFDESLTTTEDWDFFIRCAGHTGVADRIEVTSVYRWWNKDESSRTQHNQEEWRKNHLRIQQKWNESAFVLPPGCCAELFAIIEQNAAYNTAIIGTQTSLEGHQQRALVRQDILSILWSTSWRWTTPWRMAGWIFGRRAKIPVFELENYSLESLQAVRASLQNSFSWRLTAPLRKLKRNS